MFEEKYKKILLITIFVIITIFFGYLLYKLFFAPAKEPVATTPKATTTETGGFPYADTGKGQIITEEGEVQPLKEIVDKIPAKESAIANGNLTQTTEISKANSFGSALSGNGSSINYYNKNDNKFYTISKNNEITELSNKQFYNVEKVTWAPNKNKAIIEYPDGANIIYNFETEKQITLPAHWKNFDFQEVFFVGLNNENFKSTIVEGRGFEPKWQPDGKRLLYSVYSNKNNMKPNLWIVDAQGEDIGQNRKSLNLETWANKCSFGSADTLYCAVPENLPEGAGLFPELAENTRDRLYKIDTKTGIKKLLATTKESYNMTNLIISENEYNLYFTDQTTGIIHKIKLK